MGSYGKLFFRGVWGGGAVRLTPVRNRLRVVPHFPSGIVERAKRERV